MHQYLKDNPELAAEIADKLYVKYLGHHYDGKPVGENPEKPTKKKAKK